MKIPICSGCGADVGDITTDDIDCLFCGCACFRIEDDEDSAPVIDEKLVRNSRIVVTMRPADGSRDLVMIDMTQELATALAMSQGGTLTNDFLDSSTGGGFSLSITVPEESSNGKD